MAWVHGTWVQDTGSSTALQIIVHANDDQYWVKHCCHQGYYEYKRGYVETAKNSRLAKIEKVTYLMGEDQGLTNNDYVDKVVPDNTLLGVPSFARI